MKKEILKKEYKDTIFDCYYWFVKSRKTNTKEDMETYSRKVQNEMAIEQMLWALNISPEKLVPEVERDYLRRLAISTVNQ